MPACQRDLNVEELNEPHQRGDFLSMHFDYSARTVRVADKTIKRLRDWKKSLMNRHGAVDDGIRQATFRLCGSRCLGSTRLSVSPKTMRQEWDREYRSHDINELEAETVLRALSPNQEARKPESPQTRNQKAPRENAYSSQVLSAKMRLLRAAVLDFFLSTGKLGEETVNFFAEISSPQPQGWTPVPYQEGARVRVHQLGCVS
eukprot:gene20030-122_t